MKKSKKLTAAFLAVCFIIALSSCANCGVISFGTGNTGGNYYSFGSAYAQLMHEDNAKIQLDVKTTAGSAANLRLIQQGFLDIAIAQSDILMDAYSGDGDFASTPCNGIRAIAGLYIEECQIIVRAESDIYSVSDLYNKRISVGENESGVIKNAREILEANGITFDMIDGVYLSFSDSAKELEANNIDAFFCTAGAPTAAIRELAKSVPIRIIPLDETTINRMTANFFGYTACTIPANTYQGQTEDIQTVGVKAVLVAANNMPDDTAYQLTQVIFDRSSELRYFSPFAGDDTDFATSGIPISFHAGAAARYAENGINTETTDSGAVRSHPFGN